MLCSALRVLGLICNLAQQICRRIAHALGGDLTASSPGLGMGSTLTFTVPLTMPADAVPEEPPPLPPPPLLLPPLLPPPDASPAAAAGCGVGISVLVAEDDPLSQTVMRKVLSRLGLRFTLVGDGAAAVEAYTQGAAPLIAQHLTHILTVWLYCAAERFDAVLMDLHSASLDSCAVPPSRR